MHTEQSSKPISPAQSSKADCPERSSKNPSSERPRNAYASLYQLIPKVDRMLDSAAMQPLLEKYGYGLTSDALREVSDEMRRRISVCNSSEEAAQISDALENMPQLTGTYLAGLHAPGMRPVINATGTILHTNLGRAPLSDAQMEQILRVATHYSNLEYDLETGCRGTRYSHFEHLLCRITGAEAAMAVNNNASSVLLALAALGDGREIIVSRGELVEIGGKFRIPDVMKISGATLTEVGTTNKTHPEDYIRAISGRTAAIMKVHTSNYRIVGFAESVSLKDLTKIGAEYDLPVIADLGSGVLLDLARFGLEHEPTVQEVVAAGADIVCFSGDKLLGGPQAGIIVGKKKYVERMKEHQLTRALRIDKFTACALEVVLREYLYESRAISTIPVLRMITQLPETIKTRAETLEASLHQSHPDWQIRVIPTTTSIGGGSLPLQTLPGYAVALKVPGCTDAAFEKKLRHLPLPVIARIAESEVLLEMRTVSDEELMTLIEEL